MTERVTGYLLLILGLVVIIYSSFSVYRVFSGQGRPFTLFSFNAISVDATDLVGGNLTPQEKALAKQQLGNSQIELFPAEILNTTTNTIAHLLFMGFMVTVGYRISMLGVNLVRPINVRVGKEKLPLNT